MVILKGHVSQETAFVVPDYPYGFRLRCQIRYWLESNKHGTRLMSQTSNPKRPGLVWNKAKASTYSKFAGCMYLNSLGHVEWSGLDIYASADESRAWLECYKDGLCETDLNRVSAWIRSKELYERDPATWKQQLMKELIAANKGGTANA